MSDTAVVFNIQRYCINDGPGIRTTVFLKGCPLSCVWCHNPESKNVSPEGILRVNLCASCGECVKVCEADCHSITEEGKHIFAPVKCTMCGECIKSCPKNAMELTGKEMSVEEVMAEVLQDKIFYEASQGGMTVSGGEPFYQSEFLCKLLKACKMAGISTAVETCGFVSPEKLSKASPFVDLFLYDYKLTDSDLHKKYTGVDNELILSNLKLLNSLGNDVILRCPIIPGVNDNEEHFKSIGALTEKYSNILKVEVEPYHRLGENKYAGLGRKAESYTVPDQEMKDMWLHKLEKLCKCRVVVN